MHKKVVLQLIMILVALVASIFFLFCDLGFGLTPLSKFFIVFFGIIIGFQSIPAILLFSGMIKGILKRSEAAERVLH